MREIKGVHVNRDMASVFASEIEVALNPAKEY
jgi:hypothetical protein